MMVLQRLIDTHNRMKTYGLDCSESMAICASEIDELATDLSAHCKAPSLVVDTIRLAITAGKGTVCGHPIKVL